MVFEDFIRFFSSQKAAVEHTAVEQIKPHGAMAGGMSGLTNLSPYKIKSTNLKGI